MNQPKAAGKFEIDVVTTLAAQVTTLMKKIDALGMQPTHQVAMVCELCADNHPSNQCVISLETINYIGNNNKHDMNSDTYDPG